MARYIARKCPRCRDYFGVVVKHWANRKREFLVSGFCEICGYRLEGWRVILGRKRPRYVYAGRVPKAFS